MFTVIRAKTGIYVPVNPENVNSILRPVAKGQLCLIPTDFKLDESKYEVFNIYEKKVELKTEVKAKRAYNKKQK